MKNPYILNVQKFSVHDGPGIRTTVFFKGCPLHCHWCHNPESQRYEKELLFDKEKCTGCGYCIRGCGENAISLKEVGIGEACASKQSEKEETIGKSEKTAKIAVTDFAKCLSCGECGDYCLGNNREVAGRTYDIEELVKILLQDQVFYEQSGGGVTLSGGEVMTQNMDYVEKLCQCLKKHGISIAVDTCGYAPREHFERLLPYVDLFLYDIKIMEEEKHRYYTGVSNGKIRSNMEYLASQNANLNIRIPVIQSVNEEDEDMLAMISYIREKIGYPKVNLLPYHNTGSSKYAKLGRTYEGAGFSAPDLEKMEHLRQLWEQHGFIDVKIGG